MTNERISDLDPWDGINDVPKWTLGDRMRKALRHADIPIGDMAIDLDVSPATIGRWLSDRGPVKRSTLKLWALTTGVSLEWLETGSAQGITERLSVRAGQVVDLEAYRAGRVA